jgi:hypothetical protein
MYGAPGWCIIDPILRCPKYDAKDGVLVCVGVHGHEMCEDHHILGEAQRLVFLEKIVHERTSARGSNFPLDITVMRRILLCRTPEGAKRKEGFRGFIRKG